jgi:hypothetical protein
VAFVLLALSLYFFIRAVPPEEETKKAKAQRGIKFFLLFLPFLPFLFPLSFRNA